MINERIKTELLVHDLKNPITVIESSADMLIRNAERDNPLSERQLKVLGRVLRNSRIAMSLVNDILEVGRSSEGIFNKEKYRCFEYIVFPFIEIFDLIDPETAEKLSRVEAITDFTSILSSQGVNLLMDGSIWNEDIFLDIRKVRQVIRNLLSNAFKYRKNQITVEIALDNSHFIVSIMDDGKGIEREYHKKVFEKYFQLGDERESCVRGHGLGLAGALVLVEGMCGRMTLESEKDRGARFTVSIPLGN